MTQPQVTRHRVDWGERVAWEPPDGTAEFFVWAKYGTEDSALRWQRIGGWSVALNRELPFPDAPDGRGLAVTAADVRMAWADLLLLYDGFDGEIFQTTAHDAGGTLLTRDIWFLPDASATDPAAVAAQERKLLKQLVAMLTDGATVNELVQFKVATPDGTSVERMTVVALHRRIAECRARIAWFEEAARGNVLPRLEFW